MKLKEDGIFIEEDVPFDQLVKACQSLNGDTQAELADKLNCKQPTLSNVIAGRTSTGNPIIGELEDYITSSLLQAFDLMSGSINQTQEKRVRNYVKRQTKNFIDSL